MSEPGGGSAAGPVTMTVGEVATLLGVSVRTLHHWDDIGLVRPSRRSWAGYRLYSRGDVRRLQQVAAYRETGMPLELVGRTLDGSDEEALAHLSRQRELLVEQISRLRRMVDVASSMIERIERNTVSSSVSRSAGRSGGPGGSGVTGDGPAGQPAEEYLEPAELAGLWETSWGASWDPDYGQEAEQRWGHTEEWAESARRRAVMTRADWERARDECEALETELAEAVRRGVVPGSTEANTLAERHRADLSRWFETPVSRQLCLVRLYETDERLRQHYDHREPGLAAWLVEVVEASARCQGVEPGRP